MAASETSQPLLPKDNAFPSEELNACPFPFYEALRRSAPVYRDPVRGDYIVSRHADIAHVVRHPELFGVDLDGRTRSEAEAKGCPVVPEGVIVTTTEMVETDAPEHNAKRGVARKIISRGRMEDYEPTLRELVDERIDTFVDRGEVELCSEFATPLAFHMICYILGLSREDAEGYWSRGNPGSNHGMRFLSPEKLAELQSRPEPDAFLRGLIVERLENPGDDFLSEWVQAHAARAEPNLAYLTTDAALLLRAGNETTARLIASMMRLLLDNPDAFAQVRADRSLIRPAIEETLRLESPTQWVTRRCMADTEVAGVPIPAGALVVVLYASGNRDEAVWGEDPDSFRLDRPAVMKNTLAFGTGAHLCLGAPIARLEATVAFEILLDRLHGIRYAPGGEHVENIPHIQKRAPRALHLQFDAAASH